MTFLFSDSLTNDIEKVSSQIESIKLAYATEEPANYPVPDFPDYSGYFEQVSMNITGNETGEKVHPAIEQLFEPWDDVICVD